MAASDVRITNAYPLELHYIKALCLQKHYRQCIQACRDILKNTGDKLQDYPLQQTFISFYLGLAHDELARLMHDFSQAKVPAFNQAQQFYKEALESLPTHVSVPVTADEQPMPVDDDPFFDGATDTSSSQHTPRPADDDEYDPYNYSSPAFSNASPVASLNHLRTDSPPLRSPPTASRETSASDLSDLASHSSFDQILTPHKVLERDISRMSLIDDMEQPRRPTGLPRTTSTSQGLLRPIRPGSPPTTFHLPPRLPYVSNVPGKNSRLPKLVTRGSLLETPPRKQLLCDDELEASPSPVSPLGSENGISDNSTISPVSPQTPTRHALELATPARSVISHNDKQNSPDSRELRVGDHLSALRSQLSSHISMLNSAKQATISTQAARAAERSLANTAPTNGAPLVTLRANVGGTYSSSRPGSSTSSSKHDSVISNDGKRMPQTRSYWSFTPTDIKADEKRRRVEAGRQRGWVKDRFKAERYRELAERALAEL